MAYLSDKSFSFPSGHAMAVIVIGMSLYARAVLASGTNVASWTIAAGMAIIVLVGVSRVYLGVTIQ